MTVRRVAIGIPFHADLRRLTDTVRTLRGGLEGDRRIVVLADGPDPEVAAALPSLGLPVLATSEPRGGAACFNRLVATIDADVVVLLESGARVASDALERLVAVLAARPEYGLAGPSTNRSWNEQGAFPGDAPHTDGLHRVARRVARRFGDRVVPLTPLHSLGDFCFAVRRDVVEEVGAADEGFGRAPCWEMEYSARAARAGFLGAWVAGAFVHRAPVTERRAADERALFEVGRRRYQDRLCGLRLDGSRTGDAYAAHCRGEDCEHFAPLARVRLRLPFPAVRPAETAPPAPAPEPAPPAPRIPALTTSRTPLISCVMPTGDRARFAVQAARYFLRQDHPTRELVVVDDGEDDLQARLPADPRIRYRRVPPGLSIGAKRNAACELARGDVVAQWDDDDWYGDDRLTAQLEPIAAGRADVTALSDPVFYDVADGRSWRASDRLRDRMFRPADVHGGTLMFRRDLWRAGPRYPDASLAEDATFLTGVMRRGARLETMAAGDLYAYIRHGANSWRFTLGSFLDPSGWRAVGRTVPYTADLPFYAEIAGRVADGADATPTVSCIMPTRDRRAFVPQAIRCFLRQDHPAAAELLIVDDGTDRVHDLVPDDARLRYVGLDSPMVLGDKRNLCNELATGQLLLHWDDDDWSSPNRVRRQIRALLESGADVGGARALPFYDPASRSAWRYTYPARAGRWVAGTTLAYRREAWRRRPFPSVTIGEDTQFVRAQPGVAVHVDEEPEPLVVAIVHAGNSSPKRMRGAYWTAVDAAAVRAHLGEDAAFYDSFAT